MVLPVEASSSSATRLLMLNSGRSMYGLVSVWAGRSVRICALVGPLAFRGGRCVVPSCTIRIAAAPR